MLKARGVAYGEEIVVAKLEDTLWDIEPGPDEFEVTLGHEVVSGANVGGGDLVEVAGVNSIKLLLYRLGFQKTTGF